MWQHLRAVVAWWSLGIIVLAGCAHQPPQPSKSQQVLDSLIGRLTYNDALLRFGPPARCAMGDQEHPGQAEQDRLRICTWEMRRGSATAMTIGDSTFIDEIPPSTMQLAFQSGKLVRYRLLGPWR